MQIKSPLGRGLVSGLFRNLPAGMTDSANVRNFADVREAALYYARLGLKIVPIAAGKKLPDTRLAPHGYKDASSEPARVRDWIQKGLRNVGIATGYDDARGWGIAVVDFDPRAGGDPAKFPLPLPATLRVKTGGGGWHYYYRIDRPVRSWKPAAGVDIKAAGGYVLAPPSRTQGVYEIEEGSFENIAPAPSWIYKKSISDTSGSGRYPEGERHPAVLARAVRLRQQGLDEASLRRRVHAFNERQCDPPLPAAEVDRILDWVLDKIAPGAPRGQKREAVLDEAKEVLLEARWVRYRGGAYIVDGNKLIAAHNANVYLLSKGLRVGRERVRDLVEFVLHDKQLDDLQGIVLGDTFVYGRVGEHEGLWAHRDGILLLITPSGGPTFAPDSWPEGVYRISGSGFRHRIIVDGPPLGNGQYIKDFELYFKVLSRRLSMDWRVAAAMLLPSLFAQGNAGFIFSGPAGSGKSMFARGLAYLQRGSEWATPVGTHSRDYLAVLANSKIVFFDDSHYLDRDLQALLKTTITEGEAEVRSLYTNFETERRRLSGSVIINTTSIDDLMADFVDRCFYISFEKKSARIREDQLEDFFRERWQRALFGAIELYQRAAKVEEPKGLLPQVRFRQWLSWAYRYAVVLGVADEFVKHVRLSKIAAYRTLKYSFLIDLFLDGKIENQKSYTFSDLYQLTESGDEDEQARLARGLKSLKNRREIETIAEAFGYRVETATQRDERVRQNRLFFKFVKIDEEIVEDIEQILNETEYDERTDGFDDVPF